MTLRQFARATGWPYAELLQLPASEFRDLLALYDLRWAWVCTGVDRRTKTVTYSDRIVEINPPPMVPPYRPAPGVWSPGIQGPAL